MKDVREIEKVLNKIRNDVNEGNVTAEIIWDTLRWVTDEEEEDPHSKYVESVD